MKQCRKCGKWFDDSNLTTGSLPAHDCTPKAEVKNFGDVEKIKELSDKVTRRDKRIAELEEKHFRYRSEISHILATIGLLKDSEGDFIKDYFSGTTQEEIKARNPFEKLEDL